MKQLNFIKYGLLALILVSTSVINAQDVITDFGWVNTAPTHVSNGVIGKCNGTNIEVELTTPTLLHVVNVNQAAEIPSTTSATGNTQVIIDFSQPVYNLCLLLHDLDESGGESATGFSPAFATVTPFGTSPVFTPNISNTEVYPNGSNNTDGWINWAVPVTSLSFTYNRNTGYHMFLEEMKFDCEPSHSCVCSRKNEFITLGLVSSNGQTTSGIQLNSGGIPISTLNISLPYWESLVNSNCIDGCDLRALLNSGNIIGTLPTVAGVSPIYAGSGGPSSEIVYHFPTPTIIDESIALTMQFPPTLPLSCCQNKVDYCVKIQMITEKCEVCETTLCLSDNISSGKNQKSGKRQLSPNADGSGGKKVMIISPNPASDFINIELPQAAGFITILSSLGHTVHKQDVISKRMKLNINSLESGSYIVRYNNAEEVSTTKIVIN